MILHMDNLVVQDSNELTGNGNEAASTKPQELPFQRAPIPTVTEADVTDVGGEMDNLVASTKPQKLPCRRAPISTVTEKADVIEKAAVGGEMVTVAPDSTSVLKSAGNDGKAPLKAAGKGKYSKEEEDALVGFLKAHNIWERAGEEGGCSCLDEGGCQDWVRLQEQVTTIIAERCDASEKTTKEKMFDVIKEESQNNRNALIRDVMMVLKTFSKK